jgi:hypothetical protein
MTSESTATDVMTVPRRMRRGKKRLVFQPPKQVPSSVRLLWESASTEEKTRAHATCVAILSMWLGRSTRAQVAQELSLPPLRVWQLSQAAVSGMLAGLLKQPRGRGRGQAMDTSSEDDPKALRKRIAELEKENESLRQLTEVLRNMPKAQMPPQQRPRTKPETKPHGRKPGATEVQRRAEDGGGKAAREPGEAPPR